MYDYSVIYIDSSGNEQVCDLATDAEIKGIDEMENLLIDGGFDCGMVTTWEEIQHPTVFRVKKGGYRRWMDQH